MKTFLIFIFCSFLLLGCSQEKNETSKTSDSTKSHSKDSNKVLKKDSINSRTKDLTNESAKNAAIKQLSKNMSSLIAWKGLLKYSENEFRGSAYINKLEGERYYQMNGNFIYHQDIDNYWVLDRVEFRTESGFAYWNDYAYTPVLDSK